MKSIFEHTRVRVALGLLAAAGLMATSSCAEKKAETPAAGQAANDTATAPTATETETVVEEIVHVKATPEQLEKMVAAATSGTGQDRYAAIDDLGERAGDVTEVVPELEKNLADADAQVLWRSARALGDFGEEAVSAAPKLKDLLNNSDAVVQYHAAVALGKIGDKSEETVDALVVAVGASDPRVSRAALAALKQLKPGPVKTTAALKKAIVAEDQMVAAHAIDAIVELGAQAVPLLNEMLKDPATAYLAAAAAEQIGPDAAGTVPGLVEVLGKTKHSQLDTRILLALAHIGPGAKSAEPQIVSELETAHDPTVQVAAAFALGRIGSTDADGPLKVAAAATDKPFLSMVAAWSLAKLHPDDAALKAQAVEKLTAGTKSDDEAIKSAAEKGLMMLEVPAEGAAAKN
jgi:HEAT repeat protein